MRKVTIKSKQTIKVREDTESPIQDAENKLRNALFDLQNEGRIEDYRIIGQERDEEGTEDWYLYYGYVPHSS